YELVVPLAQSEIMLIVSDEHPFASEDSVAFAQIATEPFIGPKAEYGIFNQMPHLNRLPLQFRYEVSSQTTILAMVRENLGISMMPEMLFDTRSDGVTAVPFTPALYLRVALAAHVSSPAADAFLQTAHGWAAAHGYLPDDA
ncbi:MAG: LysR family transcriptional regulator substrate-binding protein, partial [Anaerolineae bacterium]|nr:LysR family transcriptional regulator substrate-binding protein [Anaerolineae bacterium]